MTIPVVDIRAAARRTVLIRLRRGPWDERTAEAQKAHFEKIRRLCDMDESQMKALLRAHSSLSSLSRDAFEARLEKEFDVPTYQAICQYLGKVLQNKYS